MKKLLFCIFLTSIFGANSLLAQRVKVDTSHYVRSSLCLMLMDDNKIPKADTIKGCFNALPMNSKYNNHNLNNRIFQLGEVAVGEPEYAALELAKEEAAAAGENSAGAKKKKGGFGQLVGGLAKGVAASATGGLIGGGADRDMYAAYANKLLVEQKAAKLLVDKWFINSDGAFFQDSVFKRGLYNFDAAKIEEAKLSGLGVSRIAQDSGYELLGNTFVVVSHFNYLPKDSVVAEMAATASTIGAMAGYDVSGIASLAGSATSMALGDGYFVKITAFLFKLRWNEDIQNKFFSELWDKPEAYAASDLFSLQYVGSDKAFANVKASVFKNKPEEELIYMATVNAVDAVLGKLEKRYDVFKTKTPLIVEEGSDGKSIYTAKIGLKEGVGAGDKYEVLEMVQDETGKNEYKRVGVLKVAKGQVWDNRFGADEELKLKGQEQNFTATRFEGNVKAMPGMLLRQIK